VMQELLAAKKKYNYKEVMFFDSIFFVDRKWVKELLGRFAREIGVPFRCTGHVNFMDEELVALMKEAGCYCIDFGVQTFNQDIRKNFLNRPEDNSQIQRVFTLCDNARLRYDVDLLLGLPQATETDYAMVLEMLEGHAYLNRVKCYFLSYYPQLAMVAKAREFGALAQSDVDDITRGQINDWFHADGARHAGQKRLIRNFAVLYKIYPLLPGALRRSIMRRKWYRHWYLLPWGIVVLAQLIIGAQHRDYRFWIYIRNYAFQVKKQIKILWRRGAA